MYTLLFFIPEYPPPPLQEPDIGDPTVKLVVPDLRPLSNVTDRLKHLDSKINLKANMAGELEFGAAVCMFSFCLFPFVFLNFFLFLHYCVLASVWESNSTSTWLRVGFHADVLLQQNTLKSSMAGDQL